MARTISRRPTFVTLLSLLSVAACADENASAPPQLLATERSTAEDTSDTRTDVMPVCDGTPQSEYRRCTDGEKTRWLYLESTDPFLARWVRYLQEYRDWKDAQRIQYTEWTDTMIVIGMNLYARSDAAETTPLTYHFIADPKDFWTDGEANVIAYLFGYNPGKTLPLDENVRSQCARDERRCRTYTDSFSARGVFLWADYPDLPNPKTGTRNPQGIDESNGVLFPALNVDPIWISDTYRHP